MNFKVKKTGLSKDHKNMKYVCRVKGIKMAGYGDTIEKAIKEFLNCYKFYRGVDYVS